MSGSEAAYVRVRMCGGGWGSNSDGSIFNNPRSIKMNVTGNL